jgi:phenylalanyl-tRNA synthetase beta chain
MLVSLKWLKELVEIGMTAEELADRFDMTGTAVEAIHTAGEALEGVLVGQIIAKDRHPDADTLWVTRVDVGQDEPLQIVCGAQNFEAGDKVPVALVGATLPNGMTINKAKLRGVESRGMNCSAAELGLGADQSGLLILPQDAPVGAPFAEYRGLADRIFELEITPNRPDCLCVAGVAREAGAILRASASVPASAPPESGAPATDEVTVQIEDPELCARYTARLIRGVKVGPSPDWLAERIIASGGRPLYNVVDITNYVMFELGQPLHAFDADLLARDGQGRLAIGVRLAHEGEKLTTLDGVDRDLAFDTLLITDPSGPVALAGVMGGESTEVHEGTVNVLLEAARFEPASISRTSRRLGLISEASIRFERGVDRTASAAASDRAAALIAEICGGEVAPGVVDAYPMPCQPVRLELRMARLNAFLGTDLGVEEVFDILARLGFIVASEPSPATAEGTEVLSVEVPPFRPDLEREVDIIEEVVRVWGMENVSSTLPSAGRAGGLTTDQAWRERIGTYLRGLGLNETMTYAFADPSDLERLGVALEDNERHVELLNPMSVEQAVLRRTLLPGLLKSVSYNQRRGVPDVHLYEEGSVFLATEGKKQPKERTMVAGVLAGRWQRPTWNDSADTPNAPAHLEFFDGKGVIEELAEALGIPKLRFRVAEKPWLQPGRSAEVLIGSDVAGWLGEVHPRVLDAYDCEGPVTAFELSLPQLLRSASAHRPFTDVPRFPAVELDIALVVPEDVTGERVTQAIVSAGGSMLESARLFDVYRGKGVPAGQKSMAFALTYRRPDRTLTAEEVEQAHDRLVRKVTGAVGGELRG